MVSAFYPTYHEISANKALADQFASTATPSISMTTKPDSKDDTSVHPTPSSIENQNDFEVSSTMKPEVVMRSEAVYTKPSKKLNEPEPSIDNTFTNKRGSKNNHRSRPDDREFNHKKTTTTTPLPVKKTKVVVKYKEPPKEKPSPPPQSDDNSNTDLDQDQVTPMHLIQYRDPSVRLSKKPQQEVEEVHYHAGPDDGYSGLNAEHKNSPRYEYDYDVAYRSDFYWLIPLVIIIGIGALLLPLCSLFMTTMVSNGAINLTGRRKRSIEQETTSDRILKLVTKVEEALIRISKDFKQDDFPSL